jgi:hypothetical protein
MSKKRRNKKVKRKSEEVRIGFVRRRRRRGPGGRDYGVGWDTGFI